MQIIDGKATAKTIKAEIRLEVDSLVSAGQRPPHLAAILVGHDVGSETYVAYKIKDCEEVGFKSTLVRFEDDVQEEVLLDKIKELNNDDELDGFIVQLPLPDHINEQKVIENINPTKDVDGFHPVNVGRLWRGEEGLFPCTPSGIIGLLHHHDITLEGKNAIIIGRSNIVGKPMAALLLRENCTVTVAHSRTENLRAKCLDADLLVAAVGKPRMITSGWVRKGAVIIDVGMNRDNNGDLCGDVDYNDVFSVCSAITPVPGGVGPLTIAFLLENTLTARTSFFSE